MATTVAGRVGRRTLFAAPTLRCFMARWVRWVFEIRAPADEFVRLLEQNLSLRGVTVEPAERFDFVARAFGARLYVKVDWAEVGLEVVAKTKGGLFSSPRGLEALVLEAGREAQARLTFDVGGRTV